MCSINLTNKRGKCVLFHILEGLNAASTVVAINYSECILDMIYCIWPWVVHRHSVQLVDFPYVEQRRASFEFETFSQFCIVDHGPVTGCTLFCWVRRLREGLFLSVLQRGVPILPGKGRIRLYLAKSHRPREEAR